MIINAEPEPPLAVNPKLPAPVVWLIERCLAKDPTDRYTSTRDLAREIHALRDHLGELGPASTAPRARSLRRTIVAAALTIALGGGALLTWQWTRSVTSAIAGNVTFSQLTFGHGHVPNARFAPDGQTIFYAASWNGAPLQVFETRPTGPESRPLGPASASLASISPSGELALLLGCRLNFGNCVGTLARMPPGGGAPRKILEDVVSADWAPDGETLAAIQLAAGEYVLHFPPGKRLYATEKKIGYMRFSPHGDRLAFVEHERVDAEAGVLKVIDLEGRRTTLTGRHDIMRELVWSSAGDEILVTASARGTNTSVYAVSLSGEQRVLLHAPGALSILDLRQDGRALMANGLARAHMVWARGSEARELSWLDWSTVADLSPDGKTVLFSEWGHAVGSSPVVYMRTVDGADAVRLGEGTALALAPDGLWALALRETPQPQLVLLPTGAGATRALPPHGLTDLYWARWFPDGGRLLVVGAGPDGVPGSFIQDLQSGRLEEVGEKGMLAVLVSPDGRRLLMSDPLTGYQIWPLDGQPPSELPGLDAADRPLQWTAGGQLLYVKEPGELALGLYRFDLATGKSMLITELVPSDLSGVVGVGGGRGQVAVTPDGKSYVYTYWTFIRDLFLVEGLPR
jgi:Tol biopolymer transport system component